MPFKSLRFPATEEQTWGTVLVRWIVGNNESATWPRVGLSQASVGLVVRPQRHRRLENTYLLDRLIEPTTRESVFNNNIFRSVGTLQFNKELSFNLYPLTFLLTFLAGVA